MNEIDIYTEKNLKAINDKLSISNSYGLNAEVIICALDAMKYNPELSIVKAFDIGCTKWDLL